MQRTQPFLEAFCPRYVPDLVYQPDFGGSADPFADPFPSVRCSRCLPCFPDRLLDTVLCVSVPVPGCSLPTPLWAALARSGLQGRAAWCQPWKYTCLVVATGLLWLRRSAWWDLSMLWWSLCTSPRWKSMDKHVSRRGVPCGKRDPSADAGEASEVANSELGGPAPRWLEHRGRVARCCCGQRVAGAAPRGASATACVWCN